MSQIGRKLACVLGMSGMMMVSTQLTAAAVHVYGLKAPVSHKKNASYIVNLASFNNEAYAKNYRRMVQNKIHIPVHMSHQSGAKKIYSVSIGPINLTQLTQVRAILLNERAPKPITSAKIKSTSAHKKKHAVLMQTNKEVKASYEEVSSSSKERVSHASVPHDFLKQQFVTLSGGIGWAKPEQTQTIFLVSDAQNAYNDQSDSQVLGLGELFFGIEKPLNERIQSQWGFLISGAGMAEDKGIIWQYADPQFDNLSYSYKLNQLRFGLRSKWILDNTSYMHHIKPYITGSVGVGLNHAYDYNNTANIDTAVPNPNFQDNTMASFSYSAGLGLQKDLTSNIQAGLGYEMLDWGKSSLAAAPGQTINAGLVMDHLYMHTLLLSLTYHA